MISASFDTAADELSTVCDFVRFGVSAFNEAGLFYGHGTDNPHDEAVFMVLETLKLPVDMLDPYWHAKLTMNERRRVADAIRERALTRKPAPYILNRAYIQGVGFYVDERVLIPRSYIAEILGTPGGFAEIPDYNAVRRVLDLCTGSACLAILAAMIFPNATVDAVDISEDALAVASKNVTLHGLEERVNLYKGDLYAPLGGQAYDLIIANPPYVDAEGMAHLPPEYEHEPQLALASGADGLDATRGIIAGTRKHLTRGGGLLCEVGRCGPALAETFPSLPFSWIDTAQSAAEVFWLRQQDLP